VTNNPNFAQLRGRTDWYDSIATHLQRIKKDVVQIENKAMQMYVVQRANDLLSLIAENDARFAQGLELLTPLLLGLLDLMNTEAKARFGADSPEERRSSEVLLRVAEQLRRWGGFKG
jgi:hypothetical protein